MAFGGLRQGRSTFQFWRGGGSQPRAGQSTSYGDVKSAYGGGRRVAQEWVRKRGTQERQQTGGGATQTHRTREPHQEGRGRAQQTRRRGTARQERQPGQGTRMEGMGERAHGRQRQQRGAWPASPVATGCQGNPCSTGIRWGGVSRIPDGLFAQQVREPTRGRPAMRGKGTYGGWSGQRVDEQGTWASRTRKHSEAGYGRPVDRGVWTAKTVPDPDPDNNQHNLNTPTTGRR